MPTRTQTQSPADTGNAIIDPPRTADERQTALADLAAMRARQATVNARIEETTATLIALCNEAVATDKSIANCQRRANQQVGRQWQANRIANYLRWRLAGVLPDLGMPHPSLRRPLVEQPREATTAMAGA